MQDLMQYAPLLPEIVLAVGALALLVISASLPDRPGTREIATWLAVFVLAGAAVLAGNLEPTGQSLFHGAFIADAFAQFMKILILGGGAVSLLLSLDFFGRERLAAAEFPVLVLLSTLGMMMMVSAGDLIALYIGLELQSLAFYVIAAISRDNLRASEAGLKYFVLGALSSGMLLYGASLLYGFTGVTDFAGIAAASKAPGAVASLGLAFGLVFLLVGLAFKISAVPFHMWTPDVYEGAPTPVTTFFAAAGKLAAMALLVRAVITAFPGIAREWQQIVVFLAIASMGLGSVAAIGQNNIKRLMAYSSIGHAGFALVGLAPGNPEGVQGVLIYLAIYVVMTLGTFAVILAMRREKGMVEEISELAGLARTNLPMAVTLAALLFSLAGIPPLAGFFAKFYVFAAAVKGGFVTLAVLGVILSVVSAYYYIRIVKLMFFDEPRERFLPVDMKAGLVMGIAGLAMVFFAFAPGPLIAAAWAAARSLPF